jgi:phage baseplate assembly protein W
VADEVIITAPVNLAPLANSSPTYSIIGPILPMDVGFPNPDQWDFNTSTDETVLASSVKMILLTKIGERTMLPEFGCNVYRLLFNPMTSNTGDIQKDIQDAITRWEPRVAVSSVQVSIDENGRQASVDVQLISKLTKSAFSTTVQFLA